MCSCIDDIEYGEASLTDLQSLYTYNLLYLKWTIYRYTNLISFQHNEPN